MAVSAIWQPRGWSFRTRLAVTIGAVFVAAAAALLVVEYLAVDKLFDAAITSSSVGIAGGARRHARHYLRAR